jgi:hypothetical protein
MVEKLEYLVFGNCLGNVLFLLPWVAFFCGGRCSGGVFGVLPRVVGGMVWACPLGYLSLAIFFRDR